MVNWKKQEVSEIEPGEILYIECQVVDGPCFYCPVEVLRKLDAEKVEVVLPDRTVVWVNDLRKKVYY